MTVAMLMMNTVDSAKRSLQMQKVSPTLKMGLSLAPLFPYLKRLILRKWLFKQKLIYLLCSGTTEVEYWISGVVFIV